MATYYNDNDPKVCAWLIELIKAEIIPGGVVDCRSITEISPHELTRFTQQHFFAGIGGWPYALRIAGWRDDRPVRTGSCPCQPFASPGLQLGFKDPRHLWPVFRDLITFGEATTTFGEQVASALGRDWLARVRSDLEGVGYEVGAADLCSACVGSKDPKFQESAEFLEELARFANKRGHTDIAQRIRLAAQHIAGLIIGPPHIRQRLFWVANPTGKRWRKRPGQLGQVHREGSGQSKPSINGIVGRVADPDGRHTSPERLQRGGKHRQRTQDRCVGGVGDSNEQGSQGRNLPRNGSDERPAGSSGLAGAMEHSHGTGRIRPTEGRSIEKTNGGKYHVGFWSEFDVLTCTDGSARRVESGTFPLAHGIPGRVGLLRGYGNAINPWLAAEFIQASEEVALK